MRQENSTYRENNKIDNYLNMYNTRKVLITGGGVIHDSFARGRPDIKHYLSQPQIGLNKTGKSSIDTKS